MWVSELLPAWDTSRIQDCVCDLHSCVFVFWKKEEKFLKERQGL